MALQQGAPSQPDATTDLAIVVVAAGSSSRFGSDKLSAPLGGKTVLEHAVEAVRSPLAAARVVLVVRPEDVATLESAWAPRNVEVVAGGVRRQDSVRLGCAAIGAKDDALVLVHDGARPFVPPDDVRRVVAAAAEAGAALLVAPVVDTVKRVSGGRAIATVPRHDLARALTPQAFRFGVLRRAWAVAGEGEWTDEAALVEAAGGEVRVVEGDSRNVKVTRPEDLDVLHGVFPRQVRIGQGIDVHPFAPGRPLWLAGVEIEGEIGLAGHSDADAVLHAITDAILGASGAGDIGEHFPPSDARWRDARSEVFVRHSLALAVQAGLRPVHCDVTVLAERPRIGPHRERMRLRLGELLSLPIERVSIKATTCEGLGFVGRGEGLMATAIVTLESD